MIAMGQYTLPPLESALQERVASCLAITTSGGLLFAPRLTRGGANDRLVQDYE
jgi:hypothetical protein